MGSWGWSVAPLGRGVRLAGFALTEALLLLWICLVACLCCVGIGLPLLPGALATTRSAARRQRCLAAKWSGVTVPELYPPMTPGLRGAVAALRARSTWRDLCWLLVNPMIGPVLGLAPALLVIHGLFGLTLPFTWPTVTRAWDGTWFAFIPIRGQLTADLANGLGVVEIALALTVLPRLLLPLHGRWVATVLGASRTELSAEVAHLSGSRSDAIRMQADELRRIERDLHDGAQVRLVALGMTLSSAESMLERDPDAVRALLAEAKRDSAAALKELRDLVHGVHPPLLADRGLVDAVRALALGLPVRVRVDGELAARPPAPVESAAYFAVAELLANVVKHAGAETASVGIRYVDGRLRVTVEDDGVGGADERKGSGLRGVARRLAVVDATLAVASPDGGPTRITFGIPCALAEPVRAAAG